MNFNLFGHADQWIAVDCGITLEQVPGALRPSVQMPDLRFIATRREQLAGLIVTHAHEDHLGATALSLGATAVSGLCHPLCSRRVAGKKHGAAGGCCRSSLIEIEPGEQIRVGPLRYRVDSDYSFHS